MLLLPVIITLTGSNGRSGGRHSSTRIAHQRLRALAPGGPRSAKPPDAGPFGWRPRERRPRPARLVSSHSIFRSAWYRLFSLVRSTFDGIRCSPFWPAIAVVCPCQWYGSRRECGLVLRWTGGERRSGCAGNEMLEPSSPAGPVLFLRSPCEDRHMVSIPLFYLSCRCRLVRSTTARRRSVGICIETCCLG